MDEKGNNLWGLHSGITRYTTHELSNVKAKQDTGRANQQIERLLMGNAYKMNQTSMDFVKELV